MSAAFSTGQMVHSVLLPNSHRPAIITRMWAHRDAAGAQANLTVFLDDDKDERVMQRMQESWLSSGPLLEVKQLAPLIWQVTGAMQDEIGRGSATWHWPERP